MEFQGGIGNTYLLFSAVGLPQYQPRFLDRKVFVYAGQ